MSLSAAAVCTAYSRPEVEQTANGWIMWKTEGQCLAPDEFYNQVYSNDQARTGNGRRPTLRSTGRRNHVFFQIRSLMAGAHWHFSPPVSAALGIQERDSRMSLQDQLLTLSLIDGRVVKAAIERDMESLRTALGEYLDLRKTIRTRLLDQSVASIEDPHAVHLLRKITTGDGLPTDRLIEDLNSPAEPGQLLEEFSEEELDSLGSRLFYSWFSHVEYITGLSELCPLVVRSSASESVVGLVRQINVVVHFILTKAFTLPRLDSMCETCLVPCVAL